jgi:ribosomal protein L37AE/L43A
MSHHHTSYNYRQTDESTTNDTAAPTECPACDWPEITVENDLWHCGHCGASGLIGGESA